MKKLAMLALSGAFLASNAIPVFAAEINPTHPVIDAAARCQERQVKIGERLEKIASRHSGHMDKLNDAVSKLNNLVSIFSDKGINTSTLESDIDTLEGMIAELNSDHEAVVDSLEAAKSVDCSTIDRDSAQAKIDEAKALMQEVKDDVTAIKSFKETVKSHISDLKGELETNS